VRASKQKKRRLFRENHDIIITVIKEKVISLNLSRSAQKLIRKNTSMNYGDYALLHHQERLLFNIIARFFNGPCMVFFKYGVAKIGKTIKSFCHYGPRQNSSKNAYFSMK